MNSVYKSCSICFIVVTWMVGLLSWQQVCAQKVAEVSVKALEVGDKIPEELWNSPLEVVNDPQGRKFVTLNEYRDKLIILDFWATWCGTCVASLPRLHQLEKAFKDDLVILPVTDQKARDIVAFLKKNHLLSPLNLFSVVSDSLYKSYFPYTMLPHEVWIDPSGKVYALTHSADVTAESIQHALQGGKSTMKLKKDNLTYDSGLPLLLNDNGAEADFFLNRSILTPRIEGIPTVISVQPKINESDSTFRISATNTTVRGLYSMAFRELRTLPANRMKLELQGSDANVKRKILEQVYCYEWIAPLTSLKSLRKKIASELNYLLNVYARMEKRTVNAYSVQIIGKTTLLTGRPEKGLQYLSAWVRTMNKDARHVPVVNDFEELKIAIPLIPAAVEDLTATNKLLKPFGIALFEEKRVLDFFVISDEGEDN